MSKPTELLDSFLYELTSYLVPGVFFTLFSYNAILVIFQGESINKISDLVSPFSCFGFLEWTVFFLFSFILGMFIAGNVFYLHRSNGPLKRFHALYGFYIVLSQESDKGLIKVYNHILANKIYENLKIDIRNKNDHDTKDIFAHVGELVINYVTENSKVVLPIARFYPRICLFSNLSYVFLFFGILNFFILYNINLGYRILIFVCCAILYALFMIYVSNQIKWRADYVLKKFYIITN